MVGIIAKQNHQWHVNKFFATTGVLCECALLGLGIAGIKRCLAGSQLLIASPTLFLSSTLLHVAQKNFAGRKIEVIIQVLESIAMCVALGVIMAKSLLPAYHFSIAITALIGLPIACNGVLLLRAYQEYMLQRGVKKLGVSCKKIDLIDLQGKPTTAFCMENPTIPFQPLGKEIRVATYNTACMLAPISIGLNKMRHPLERAGEIKERLEKLQLPHIFGQQEMFSLEATGEVMKALYTFYPNVLFSIAPFDGKVGTNSGLLFACKAKINRVEFVPLYCSGEDGLAKKGVLIVDIGEEEDQIRVINAHLVSGESKREEQLQQLRVIQGLIAKSPYPVILMGDFNLGYEDVSSTLSEMHFLKTSSGTFYNTEEHWERNRSIYPTFTRDQLDHIGHSKGFTHLQEEDHHSLFQNGCSPPPSDHRPLFATLKRS